MGPFDEIQEQLTWLSSQPHQYKLVIAGNHEVVLDEGFLERYLERIFGQVKTLQDLDWSSVHYPRDSSITLSFLILINPVTRRSFTVYKSPKSPQYVPSAFQYPRDQDVQAGRVPTNLDIVITRDPASPKSGHARLLRVPRRLPVPFSGDCPRATESCGLWPHTRRMWLGGCGA